MNCQGENRFGKRCGNTALNGSRFCAYHQPKPTTLRKVLQRLTLFITATAFIVGFFADIFSVKDISHKILPQPQIIPGIDLIEGGILSVKNCGKDCAVEFSGSTPDSKYETVFHITFIEEAGDCLALGISLYNQSKKIAKNLRAQISLSSLSESEYEFCEDLGMESFNVFDQDDVMRIFTKNLGTAVANYQISEIGPNEIGFLTVPLRKKDNLFLKRSNGYVYLQGEPMGIDVRVYGDGISEITYPALFYFQEVSDISQSLSDHSMLWIYHSKYTKRALSYWDKAVSIFPFLRGYSGPRYTEYILGFYDAPNVEGVPGYSTVRPPIIKNVVDTKDESIEVEYKKYSRAKSALCLDLVRLEEGEDYPCMVNSKTKDSL